MELIINNLEMVFLAMGFLALSWLANMFLSIYSNITIYHESFNKTKLLKGFLKLFVVCISTALLTLIITLFPEYLTKYGVEIEGLEQFNVMAVAIAYASVAIKYLGKSVSKLMDILKDIEPIDDDDYIA